MTYFGFLLRFLIVPILVLGALVLYHQISSKRRRGPKLATGWHWDNRFAWIAIGLHILIAVIYTTPWDNYLVATGVWWYDPELVTGVSLGWVPIEEYAFFVLQTTMVGLWLLFLVLGKSGSCWWSRAFCRVCFLFFFFFVIVIVIIIQPIKHRRGSTRHGVEP